MNYQNLLDKSEGPANLKWKRADFKDCSDFMLDQIGKAAKENELTLYILNECSDSIVWAIGPQMIISSHLKKQSVVIEPDPDTFVKAYRKSCR